MGRINTILFTNAKIVIIKKNAKFRTYPKIGIPLKIRALRIARQDTRTSWTFPTVPLGKPFDL